MSNPDKNKAAKNEKNTKFKKASSLSDAVTIAMNEYFEHLEEEIPADLYSLVLREVEVPLLKVVMHRTKNNQSLATQMLGLNRGTLRKKLKEYNLI